MSKCHKDYFDQMIKWHEDNADTFLERALVCLQSISSHDEQIEFLGELKFFGYWTCAREGNSLIDDDEWPTVIEDIKDELTESIELAVKKVMARELMQRKEREQS